MNTYHAPTITDHGSMVALTQASPQPNDGNDPCSERGPHLFKQTGAADYIQGQANLMTCVPTGSV